jgi:hypothetical protein
MNTAAETDGATSVPPCSGVGLINGTMTALMEASAATAELTIAIGLNMVQVIRWTAAVALVNAFQQAAQTFYVVFL